MYVFRSQNDAVELESGRLDIRRRLLWDTIRLATAIDLAPFSGTFSA
jgi:hypothetical protein